MHWGKLADGFYWAEKGTKRLRTLAVLCAAVSALSILLGTTLGYFLVLLGLAGVFAYIWMILKALEKALEALHE
jgi:hypothetical protein